MGSSQTGPANCEAHPSSPGPTHHRVPDAAGEGHPAAFPARVHVSAVEVDIEVPVVGPSGSAARPLRGGRRTPGEPGPAQEPHPVWGQAQAAGRQGWAGRAGALRQPGRRVAPPQTGQAWAQGHQSSLRLLPGLVGAGESRKGFLSLSPSARKAEKRKGGGKDGGPRTVASSRPP